MTVAVRLPDEMENIPSLEFSLLQQANLLKDIEAVKEVTDHTEGKPLCQICRLHVATRVVVPCGHWGGCYECIKHFVDTQKYF